MIIINFEILCIITGWRKPSLFESSHLFVRKIMLFAIFIEIRIETVNSFFHTRLFDYVVDAFEALSMTGKILRCLSTFDVFRRSEPIIYVDAPIFLILRLLNFHVISSIF